MTMGPPLAIPAPTAPYGQWFGGQVTARAHCVVAANPGPMTLDGTNTWLLREPGSGEVVVVDPGPLLPEHLRAVRQAAEHEDGRIVAVVLTHRHADHAESAAHFAAEVGVGVQALGGGQDALGDGEHLSVAGLEIVVAATPGHTSDSLSLLVPADGALVSGDTVLGRGTTVVAWPDGSLSDYLESLDRLGAECERSVLTTILPGHGPTVTDAAAMIRGYAQHRRARLEQVAQALELGITTPRDIVATVYADQPPSLWPAAELSVRAQLDYLRRPR